MSKIGRQPIVIPDGVDVKIGENKITVSGPNGTLERMFPASVKVGRQEHTILVQSDAPALWGTWRAHIANMVKGVEEGFTRALEVHGVGYKGLLQGNVVTFFLGFSHPVNVQIPKGIEVSVKENEVTVRGADKEKVGQFASFLRSLRKPDPYKGKGIRYVGEVIKLKPGKKVGAGQTT